MPGAAQPDGAGHSDDSGDSDPSCAGGAKGKEPARNKGKELKRKVAHRGADNSVPWEKLRLRDAVMTEYETPGSYTTARMKDFGDWSVSHVRGLVKDLPAGLENSQKHSSLFRAASDRIGIPYAGGYTVEELKEALYRVASKQLGFRAAVRAYGITKSPLAKHLGRLGKDRELRGDELRKAINRLQLKGKGAPPYFLLGELALKMAEAGAQNRMAAGTSQAMVATELAGFLHAQAEKLPDGDRNKERLARATCSRRFMDESKRKLREAGLVDMNPRSLKVSKISHKRASVQQAYLTEAMFDKMQAMYARHYAAGILKTPEPEAWQVYNGDEIGFDPSGHWCRVLKFRWDKQRFSIGTGEKAPFWVSVYFWTRADGQFVIPVAIIHQGQQPDMDVGNLMRGMELDESGTPVCFVPESFCMHQSPSGYNDELGFSRIVDHFRQFCGARQPLYIYIDGHRSHWDPQALESLESDHIFPFFLRSANSTSDQPNDNGPNAEIKSCYARNYGEVYGGKDGYSRVVPMNAAIFNKIFTKTWEEFIVKSNQTVVKAFATCGLHPLNRAACRLQPGASTIGAMFSGQVSEDLVQDPSAPERLPDTLHTEEGVRITGTRDGRAVTDAGLLVRAAALEWFLRPALKDAAQTAKEVAGFKKLKGIKVKPGQSGSQQRLSTAMPSTLEGCEVTRDVIGLAKTAIENARKNETAAARRKEEQEKVRVIARAERKEAAMKLVGECREALAQAQPLEGVTKVVAKTKVGDLKKVARFLKGALEAKKAAAACVATLKAAMESKAKKAGCVAAVSAGILEFDAVCADEGAVGGAEDAAESDDEAACDAAAAAATEQGREQESDEDSGSDAGEGPSRVDGEDENE